MYVIFGVILFICVLFCIIFFIKKHYIIRKICSMDFSDKINLIDDLLTPFGFCYIPDKNIITTTLNAWQRKFGYCTLYDLTAWHFNMIFDCEPIYFNYDNRTWRIELWKGQYGINIGAEIGIYYSNRILSPDEYDTELFHSIDDKELFPVSMKLYQNNQFLFHNSRPHWWLTGFYMGRFCNPRELTMKASITFPNQKMMYLFVESLIQNGYDQHDIKIYAQTVSFYFSTPHTKQKHLKHHFLIKIIQCQNRILCKLFNFVTRHFECTGDKILYLYFYIPSIFRHIFFVRKNRKQKLKKRRRNSI